MATSYPANKQKMGYQRGRRTVVASIAYSKFAVLLPRYDTVVVPI